jgi:hypothetical protein
MCAVLVHTCPVPDGARFEPWGALWLFLAENSSLLLVKPGAGGVCFLLSPLAPGGGGKFKENE